MKHDCVAPVNSCAVITHSFTSTLSYNPQLPVEKHLYCMSALKYVWGVFILTAHSVYINTSLCGKRSMHHCVCTSGLWLGLPFTQVKLVSECAYLQQLVFPSYINSSLIVLIWIPVSTLLYLLGSSAVFNRLTDLYLVHLSLSMIDELSPTVNTILIHSHI